MNIKHCLPAALLAVLPTVATAAPTQLSLPEAVRQALAENHLLKAAGHEEQAAVAGVKSSRSRYLPRITMEEGAVLTNSPTRAFMLRLDEGRFSLAGDLNHPPTSGDFQTAFTLEQPLYDRRISTGAALAEKEREKSELTLKQRREEVALMTINAYLDAQQARAQAQVAEQALKDAGEHLRLAVARAGAGVGLKSDELRARTYVAEMDQRLITSRNDEQIALLRLARTIGTDDGNGVAIGAPFVTTAATAAAPELEQQAVAQRLDLKGLATDVSRADLGVRMARSAFFPTLYSQARFQMNDRDVPFGRDNDAWLLGLSLRWDLFDGRQRCNETDKARALKQSAEEYLADQRQEVRLQVQESLLRRQEVAKRLEVAKHAVADAAEGVRLLTKRYENSVALMVELLDAQTTLNRAKTDVARLEAEYARATARVWFVSGTLLKEVMQ